MNDLIINDFIDFISEKYEIDEMGFSILYNEPNGQADVTKTNEIIDNYIISNCYEFQDYNDSETFTFEDFEINARGAIIDYFIDALPF